MSLITANSAEVIEMVLSLPRLGAWHCDLDVDSNGEFASGDAVEVEIAGQLKLKGTAWRAESSAGCDRVRVIGGKGGLAGWARPTFYRGSTVRHIIEDLLRTAGETLDSNSDGKLLDATLPCWTVVQQPVALALDLLLEALPEGTAWRVLPAGTVWLGAESWPKAKFDYDLIEESPREDRVVVGTDAPTLVPGTTLAGRKVDYVEHTITAETIRTAIWFSDDDK